MHFVRSWLVKGYIFHNTKYMMQLNTYILPDLMHPVEEDTALVVMFTMYTFPEFPDHYSL